MKKNIIEIINSNFTEREQLLLLKELVKELKEDKSNAVDDTNKIIKKINEVNRLCNHMDYQPQYIFAVEKIEDTLCKITYKNVTGGLAIFPNTAKGNKEHREYLQNQSVIKIKANNILDETYYVDINNFIEKTYEYESGYPKVASEEDRKRQIVQHRQKEMEKELKNKNETDITVHCPQHRNNRSKVYKK